MKVLCLAFDTEELTIRLASALAQDVQVALMLPRLQSIPYMHWLNDKVDFQPFYKPRLRQPMQQLRTMHMLLQRIKAVDPDLIHLQKGHPYFSLALPWLREYPLVVSIHDPRHHVGDANSRNHIQLLMDYAYRQANQVIVHNESMKQETVKHLHIPESRVHITPLLERGDGGAQAQVEETDHEILFFGRIWRYKGLEYLIRAAPLIAQHVPDIKIVIAGQGEDFAPYRARMENPDHFEVFNEYVSPEKQAELFRRASVVVLPYIEATQSGVIPVAYTFQKPVIATTVGGLPSQVEDGKTGLLVSPANEVALAEAVVQLLRDRELRHQMGRAGKRKMDLEWSAPVVAAQTLPIYAEAIAHAQARGGKHTLDRTVVLRS